MFDFIRKKKDIGLYAPVNGEIVAIEDVPDQVFASKMMGDGLAFEFDDSLVFAPCDGKISMIAQTKHAIGITMKNGIEILIHVGLETVQFQGEGFDVLVKKGQSVKIGEPILQIDRNFFESQEINLITPMIVTNSQNYQIEKKNTKQNVLCADEYVICFK